MKKPSRVLVAASARRAIADAVIEGRRQHLELGGSLLVHHGCEPPLVAYALPMGPSADRSYGHVRTDAPYQNDAIAKVMARVPEVDYAGDWHVHPMWLPALSGTDRQTAEEILRDETSGADKLVLLLGTVRPGEEPVVLAFVAELRAGRFNVEEASLETLDDDAPEVRRRFGEALPPLEECLSARAAPPPPASAASFADRGDLRATHDTLRRIRADLDRVENALGAKATLWLADDDIGAVVRRGEREAIILFPPEYPRGAPQVFAGALERGPLDPVALLYGWSSRHPLSEPVAVALDPPNGSSGFAGGLAEALLDALRWLVGLPRADERSGDRRSP